MPLGFVSRARSQTSRCTEAVRDRRDDATTAGLSHGRETAFSACDPATARPLSLSDSLMSMKS